MALSDELFGNLGGAVSDIFGGIGSLKAADAYSKASQLDKENAQITANSTLISIAQARRQEMQTLGTEMAQTAGAGFTMSGSAGDLLRSSAQQASLTNALTQNQGNITALGYTAKAEAEAGQAAASKAQSGGGFLGGLLKIAGAVAPLFLA